MRCVWALLVSAGCSLLMHPAPPQLPYDGPINCVDSDELPYLDGVLAAAYAGLALKMAIDLHEPMGGNCIGCGLGTFVGLLAGAIAAPIHTASAIVGSHRAGECQQTKEQQARYTIELRDAAIEAGRSGDCGGVSRALGHLELIDPPMYGEVARDPRVAPCVVMPPFAPPPAPRDVQPTTRSR